MSENTLTALKEYKAYNIVCEQDFVDEKKLAAEPVVKPWLHRKGDRKQLGAVSCVVQ